jgi:hypothetical protein
MSQVNENKFKTQDQTKCIKKTTYSHGNLLLYLDTIFNAYGQFCQVRLTKVND